MGLLTEKKESLDEVRHGTRRQKQHEAKTRTDNEPKGDQDSLNTRAGDTAEKEQRDTGD